MQGIDESFAAAGVLGYHGSEWATGAVRGHTISSAKLIGIKLNGMRSRKASSTPRWRASSACPSRWCRAIGLAVTEVQQVAPSAEGPS